MNVTIVASGGLPVINVDTSGDVSPAYPAYVADADGYPVTLVSDNGVPVTLLNPDGTVWTEPE